MSETHTPYPEVASQPNFPEIERRILRYWEENALFQRSVDDRPAGEHGKNEYVFYDGPPFANGLPHYGHLVTGFVKDLVPRYFTMRGKRVERRFGWDCHGLPAEMAAEKDLNIRGRIAILEYGLEKFNAYCRQSVLKYTHEWERTVTRQARWVDFRRDYKTMDLSYMESVMWAFKTLHEKGLIYEGMRVLPYSWAAESPVSNFETRIDNSFRERQDPAVTVMFKLDPRPGDPGPMHLLAWTTTPWTLPSNLALAVGPDIAYSVLALGNEYWIVGEATVARLEKELAAKLGGTQPLVHATLTGKDLVGRTYEPLFPYFKDRKVATATSKPAFVVLAGDFVSTADGTGVVHMAPGFGEDDQRVCEANGIALVCPVDHRGRFTSEVKDFEGQLVFDANKPIIKLLKDRGVLVKHETILHNYPHCWRTDEPLIYKAMSSWFVKVSAFNQRMLALNKQINWVPNHVKDGQFGKWLEGARDWSISRNRFWGSPIPVWRSDDPKYPRIDVYGSIADLERDFGVKVADLHRPYIDALTRKNPDDPTGKSTMRRVEDVLDCWFESGSMPFAQVHYPFENKQWFEDHFPADFIVEYIAQTRGWFYTLMVLATALFDKPPFLNCICHGVVLDEDGEKLSKRKQNYPAPDEVFETHGADALRWYLISSPILRGNNLAIDSKGKVFGDVIRQAILPLWNAYAFFTLYANADKIKASERCDQTAVLDRYILGKTRELVTQVGAAMDRYDVPTACQAVQAFTDALNNWYIRRSRERFWAGEKTQDKQDAYDTLYTVLVTVLKTAAPFLPLIAEEIFRGLTGKASVHLEDWPDVTRFPQDAALVRSMDLAREVCSAALGLRKAKNLRVRLPLKTLTVAGDGALLLAPYKSLIGDEVNVKDVVLAEKADVLGDFALSVNAKLLGPRLGKDVQRVIGASKSGQWKSLDDGAVEVGGVRIEPNEFELKLVSKAGVASQPLAGSRTLVGLDTVVDKALEDEGRVRDVIRLIQQARKDAGLKITDRVHVELSVPAELEQIASAALSQITEPTLANGIRFGAVTSTLYRHKTDLDGETIEIGLTNA